MRAYFGGLGAPNDGPAAAAAFATAFIADVEAAPTLKAALIRKEIGKAGLVRIIMRDLDSVRLQKSGPVLFPNLRAVAREFLEQESRKTVERLDGGMGQWDAIFGAIGAVAGAATKIYSARTDAAIQSQLVKLEQQRGQAALAIAELQAKSAQTQLAAANVAATGVPSSSPISSALESVGGWPVVSAATIAITLAVGTYLATRRR